MLNKVISLILTMTLLLFQCQSIYAQTPNINKTDEQGNRVGYWIVKGADGKLLAKGRYNDNGEKEGEWKYYMSPVGRYTSTPDVIGYYENGMKHGRWEVVENRSKLAMKGKFNLGVMEGVWIIYDQDNIKLAAGRFENGIRQGQWILFKDNQMMAKGMYEGGIKVGQWDYDYYVEKGAGHIVGHYSHEHGQHRGKVDYYKVERHPKFGTEELLVGTGTYLNGLKSGRWIEYSQGMKGELISTGYYDGEGRKTGIWSTTLNSKPFREEAFNDGKRQGSFKSHYDNGNPKYSTYFENGLELGFFSSYYENGQVKEKGAHTILENTILEDTIWHKIELPIEYHFWLIDEDFEHLNFNAIDWIAEADPVIPAEELEKRWKEFKSYAKSKKYKIKEIIRTDKQTVRVGKYVSYYNSGKVFLEGEYHPKIVFAYNPATGRRERDFARTGEWKEYDEAGYLRYVYYYDKGELKKTEDSKGREVDLLNNNAGG